MDKITIILIIIIILICCSLLSITGYIGIKVYTKPTSPMPVTYVPQAIIPTSQPRIFDNSVIVTPAPAPVLIKHDISEDTITSGTLSVNMPIPQELSGQGPTFNKSSPVPFNSPTGPSATPVISPTPVSRISTLQPPSRSMSATPRVTSLKR